MVQQPLTFGRGEVTWLGRQNEPPGRDASPPAPPVGLLDELVDGHAERLRNALAVPSIRVKRSHLL
jgi:hypothetical protein